MAEAPTNPFPEMWQVARSTFLRLTKERPDALCIGVSAASGVADVVFRLAVRARGPLSLMGVAGLFVLVGPVWGVVRTYVWALTAWAAARALGGSGTCLATSRAFAWGMLPLAVTLLAWIPAWLLLGPDLFALHVYAQNGQGGALVVFGFLVLAMVVAFIAGLVLLVRRIAVAHTLSTGRGLAAVVLGPLVVSILIMIVILMLN